MNFAKRGRRTQMYHAGVSNVLLVKRGADIMRGLRMKREGINSPSVADKWTQTGFRLAGGLAAVYLAMKLGPSLTIRGVFLQKLTRQLIHEEETGERGIRSDPLQAVGLPGAGGAGNDDTRDSGLVVQ